MAKEKNKEKVKASPVFNIIGIVLCVILIPVLAINLTLIIKSYTNKDAVPSFGGYLPMIVLTDSMSPTIDGGDLIIAKTVDPKTVKVDDIITFFDPDSRTGESILTHRVIEITKDDKGELAFITKGDYNNAADEKPVPAKSLVGTYVTRIPKAGNVAMFMQTTTGLIVCVGVPLIILVAYDIIRRRMYDKKKKGDTDELLKELEELKKQKAEAEAAEAEKAEAPVAVEAPAPQEEAPADAQVEENKE